MPVLVTQPYDDWVGWRGAPIALLGGQRASREPGANGRLNPLTSLR